jgi:hypothetical protein
MRREIVATRRSGLTTTVIKRIPSKGKQCTCIHIVPMTAELFQLFLLISIFQKIISKN